MGDRDYSTCFIPHEWFSFIVDGSGKPNLAAMVVLSELIRIQPPPKSIPFRFSYSELAKTLHLSEEVIKKAIRFLHRLGAVRYSSKKIIIPGTAFYEVYFVDIKYDVLSKIKR